MGGRVKRIGVVSMLRGVNLVGVRRVKMEDLRALYERLGFQHVSTYINSGNIVFSATPKQLDGVAARLETAFEEEFGFASETFVRTAAEMRDVIERNPFAGRGYDGSRVLATFLSVAAKQDAVSAALSAYEGPEEVVATGRELYVYYPDGVGRSKLPVARIEKALGGKGTARNWNTTTKLLELAQRLET